MQKNTSRLEFITPWPKSYNTIQCNSMQCNATQCNAMQCNAMQYNTMQYNTVQYNTIQYNIIQYKYLIIHSGFSSTIESVIAPYFAFIIMFVRKDSIKRYCPSLPTLFIYSFIYLFILFKSIFKQEHPA